MRAKWLNACGVLPSCRFAAGSHSSLKSPTSLRRLSSLSKSAPASSLRPAAQDETVLREVPLDGLDGADDAFVVRGQETDSRDEQEARVEVRAVVGLHEGVQRLFRLDRATRVEGADVGRP